MPVPASPRRSFASVFVLAFVAAVLVLAACRWFPAGSPPAPAGSSSADTAASPPALSRMRVIVSAVRPLLGLANIACLALPAPDDRSTCQSSVAALRALLGIADGVLTTAASCGEADRACLEAAEAEAERRLPELEQLAGQIEQLAQGADPGALQQLADTEPGDGGAGEPQ
jgi:hypothetical protein